MKSNKSLLLCSFALLAVIGGAISLLTFPHFPIRLAKTQPEAHFRANGKKIERLINGEWQNFSLTGVNIGSGYPGYFPNDAAIPEETYLRWFQMISEMNANTLRVYQLQSPGFYTALLRHNENSPAPLYLIQGADFPDQMMYSQENPLDPQTTEELFRTSRQMVNALHGDAIELDPKRGNLNLYTADVSPYVLGYNLGVEWDEVFVEYVCRINPDVHSFSGNYFICGEDATPFEIFLAGWGEHVLAYESERYGTQPMMSFANWAETDPLENEIQVLSTSKNIPRKNSENQVDVNHIHPTAGNHSGLFAAYNIYPYFPLFLQYGQYTLFVDDTGTNNPYQGYLTQLVEHHTCPVVITEYGIPASRSTAYRDSWRGFSHGGLNEVEQGQAVAALYRDIVKSGCAGSFIFSWQDEWFKRIWNEMLISDPNYRPLWSNIQCAEQNFGLLAFEPGSPDSIVYPDGNLSDWDAEDLLSSSAEGSLSMKSDEKYLYFMATGLDHRAGSPAISLALDITPKSGTDQFDRHHFSHSVDFIIEIGWDGHGSLRVHAPYDLLVYSMADKLHLSMNVEDLTTLTEQYFPDNEAELQQDAFRVVSRACGSVYGFMRHRYEVEPVGNLHAGNCNPASPDFDSNADYFIHDDSVEIRIPWQLLNFRDPSSGTIVDDLAEHEMRIESLSIDSIYAAPFHSRDIEVDRFAEYPLTGWKKPQWHERLKASYYILQKEFEGAN